MNEDPIKLHWPRWRKSGQEAHRGWVSPQLLGGSRTPQGPPWGLPSCGRRHWAHICGADSASGRQGWADATPWEPRGAGCPTAPRNPQRHVESLELAARPQASHGAVFTYFFKYPSPYNLNQHTSCYYKSSVCPWQTSKCSRRAQNGK